MEDGKLIISISGRMDSANAAQIEAEISEIRKAQPCGVIDMDCDQLAYVSSAGLRVILRLIKDTGKLTLINVHTELYEILDMTSFTDIVEVHKAYRVFSVAGCDVIGKGANGRVYRIDRETILKVYQNPDALPEIQRERELARLAFVAGVPTALPYDVVRVEGGGYGSVFELLNAKSFADLVVDGDKTLDEVAEMSIRLLKLIHSKELHSEILPSMKTVVLGWADFLRDYLEPQQFEKLHSLIDAVPDDGHLIHGDYHLNNVMLQNGESLLIDMDTLSHGHPIFELANMYNAYLGFGLTNPNQQLEFFGIPQETCALLWRKCLMLYLDTQDAAVIDAVEAKAKLAGLTRLMRREIRRGGLETEDGRIMIKACRDNINELLTRVDSLVF